MHFKSLELFGFKSFADRTRMDFEPGVTAIVGPNGCGKSNIADSIKWVLGEQSAKMLRGGKMEDVIFNGTDGKEPVGYAEVSLTLANHDRVLPIEYDEITVSRRLYRSGESEYLLNKTPVRLKDINELFMGTGIGTSAYSLIEQGRIDQVLSSRPEDRREIFEEASGITKYKSKKKEALRRLEDTDQNLLRINDIILEVKRQINSTERQARKAERYKERYDELKELELRLSRIDLEILKQRLSQSTVNLEGFRERETGLGSELRKVTDELSRLNLERSEIESKRMDFKTGIIETNSEISKSRDRLALNKERIEELKKRQADIEEEMSKNKDSISSQLREVTNLREKVTVLEAENLERASTLSEKEKRLAEILKSISENETIISTSKANIIDIASRESKLRNQIAEISTTLNSHGARLRRLRTEKDTIQEEKGSLDVKLAGLTGEIDAVEAQIASMKSERGQVSQTISGLAGDIGNLIEMSKEIHASLAMTRSRLEVLEEAKAKYEGFSSGVKAILGKRDSEGKPALVDGAQDVLANFASVKKGYEAAIESALGDHLESIVVDTMESAKNAIDYLKENSCGRASFVHQCPVFRVSSILKEGDLDTRILGRAIDFVTVNDTCRGIVEGTLEKIFIVKDLEDAMALLKDDRLPEGCTLVTLSGEIARKGFISGGDIATESGLLINRDARIKELSSGIVGLEGDFQQVEERRLNAEEEKGKLERRLEEIIAGVNEKEILLANAMSRRTGLEENIKGVMDEIALVNLEMDDMSAEVENLKKQEVAVVEALRLTEGDKRFNEERIEKSENLISEHMREKEELLIAIAEERTELGSLESKRDGLSNTLNILESSLNDVEFGLNSRKNEVENSIKKVKDLTDEIFNIENNLSGLSEQKVKKDAQLSDTEAIYHDLMRDIQEREGIFRKSEEELNTLRSTLHEVDLRKAETNYSIENLTQRIRDVYKLDLDGVPIAEDWRDMEKEQLKNEVEEKRAKLDAMGAVNLVAIEEHTELQDRFAFLTTQRDDLLKAKDSLLKAIVKINKTTKELFIETFRTIQVEFRNFFKMLFGGGDGELILLDEDNVLESGIEIVASPPGKRLQNVSLLSGGEKALTAIALIFAIFKVKPSPFCVLDEIDAPLDESNVDRFSRSLEIFTKTSQFIVITHNKKTIDMADLMYGITMQESGVSKVVSVKFAENRGTNFSDNPK